MSSRHRVELIDVELTGPAPVPGATLRWVPVNDGDETVVFSPHARLARLDDGAWTRLAPPGDAEILVGPFAQARSASTPRHVDLGRYDAPAGVYRVEVGVVELGDHGPRAGAGATAVSEPFTLAPGGPGQPPSRCQRWGRIKPSSWGQPS